MNGKPDCIYQPGTIYDEGPLGPLWFTNQRLEKAGQTIEFHKHNYDHVTQIMNGSVKFKAFKPENPDVIIAEGTRKKGDRLLIKADTFHFFEALEDNTWVQCVFALRDDQGLITDHWDGSPKSFT